MTQKNQIMLLSHRYQGNYFFMTVVLYVHIIKRHYQIANTICMFIHNNLNKNVIIYIYIGQKIIWASEDMFYSLVLFIFCNITQGIDRYEKQNIQCMHL